MSDASTYLAVFVGSKDNPRMKAFMALPEAERRAQEQQGIAAWKGWMEKHRAQIVEGGGPLGKTKRVSAQGVADISNNLGGFVVVRAASHEDAARLFEGHPQFTIFPGEGVEIMPILAVPAG